MDKLPILPYNSSRLFPGGILKIFNQILAIFTILSALILACCSKGTDPPPQPVKINAPARYFPVHQGDLWFYNNGSIIREIGGKITINGVECERVLEDFGTSQAWTVDSEKFEQHLVAGYWFDPPLVIPFNLEKDKPVHFMTKPHDFNDPSLEYDSLFASLTFKGYFTREVSDRMVDSCIRIDYLQYQVADGDSVPNTSLEYSEYYGRGIGLIDDGAIYLDSAKIDGVVVP